MQWEGLDRILYLSEVKGNIGYLVRVSALVLIRNSWCHHVRLTGRLHLQT